MEGFNSLRKREREEMEGKGEFKHEGEEGGSR